MAFWSSHRTPAMRRRQYGRPSVLPNALNTTLAWPWKNCGASVTFGGDMMRPGALCSARAGCRHRAAPARGTARRRPARLQNMKGVIMCKWAYLGCFQWRRSGEWPVDAAQDPDRRRDNNTSHACSTTILMASDMKKVPLPPCTVSRTCGSGVGCIGCTGAASDVIAICGCTPSAEENWD